MKRVFIAAAELADCYTRTHGGRQRPSRHLGRAGFTLIELLLVLGLLVVLAGGLGLALQDGDRSIALHSAQNMLASSLTLARGRAALAGRNAALLVQADPTDRENYLHRLIVAVRNPADTIWVPADTWVLLPAGVYVLPPTSPAGALSAPGVDWSGLRSSALTTSTEFVDSLACYALSFTPRGTVSGGGDIVLATAVRLPPAADVPIQFAHADAVRGVSVSSYGIATLINDRGGF
ncbi:MAG: prepilin-type N-terminal cleavage/methylation domain-containing protein [Opitutaceae bacterium]|nr:prepilin-type N-terminal cleavage/methylation domain-containing protein [Opitutaceae bacterium]